MLHNYEKKGKGQWGKWFNNPTLIKPEDSE